MGDSATFVDTSPCPRICRLLIVALTVHTLQNVSFGKQRVAHRRLRNRASSLFMQALAITVIRTRGYILKHATSEFLSLRYTQTHLKVLTGSSAAAIGMCIMKNAGSSIDAVEAAIKLLEDREITNAGYGSNLAMDGVVECDASIVDHFGRSGAVGAVARTSSLTMFIASLI